MGIEEQFDNYYDYSHPADDPVNPTTKHVALEVSDDAHNSTRKTIRTQHCLTIRTGTHNTVTAPLVESGEAVHGGSEKLKQFKNSKIRLQTDRHETYVRTSKRNPR